MKNQEKIFTIPHIISHNDLVVYKDLLEKYLIGKVIVRKRLGASAIAMPSPQGLQLMLIPYAYIEHECTEEEYNNWKFKQKLKITP